MKENLSDQIERKFIDSIELEDWEVETDSGWVSASHIHKTIEYDEWFIITSSGKHLICADDHIVFDQFNNQVFVKNLIPNKSFIQTKDGIELVISVEKTGNKSNMFDLTVESDEQRFYTNDILSHNTTTTVAYLLWLSIFSDDQNIAILANKGSLARDILGKYQLAYENLPDWLQQGVLVWNKGSVELENGSKLVAAATSSSAVRGGAFNCVDGAMKVLINDDNEIREYTIEELYNKQENSLSDVKNNQFKILSENKNFKSYHSIFRSESSDIVELHFNDGSYIKVTGDHKIHCNGDWLESKNIKEGDLVTGIDCMKEVIYKCHSDKKQYVYDVLEVEDTHNFYANGTLVKNCVFLDEFAFVPNNMANEFFNSVYPVISSGKTTQIVIVSTPNGMNLFYKLWIDAVQKRNNYKSFEIHWSDVPGRDEKWKDETIRNVGQRSFDQEFESVAGNTQIQLLDSETNTITELSIEQLYTNLNELSSKK